MKKNHPSPCRQLFRNQPKSVGSGPQKGQFSSCRQLISRISEPTKLAVCRKKTAFCFRRKSILLPADSFFWNQQKCWKTEFPMKKWPWSGQMFIKIICNFRNPRAPVTSKKKTNSRTIWQKVIHSFDQGWLFFLFFLLVTGARGVIQYYDKHR